MVEEKSKFITWNEQRFFCFLNATLFFDDGMRDGTRMGLQIISKFASFIYKEFASRGLPSLIISTRRDTHIQNQSFLTLYGQVFVQILQSLWRLVEMLKLSTMCLLLI